MTDMFLGLVFKIRKGSTLAAGWTIFLSLLETSVNPGPLGVRQVNLTCEAELGTWTGSQGNVAVQYSNPTQELQPLGCSNLFTRSADAAQRGLALAL